MLFINETRKSKGYVFIVTQEKVHQAQEASETLETMFDNCLIKVEFPNE